MVTPITKEDFDALPCPGKPHSPAFDGIRALKPGTGLKTPCAWKHTEKKGNCTGIGALGRLRKETGFTLQGRCKDGTFYVFRYV